MVHDPSRERSGARRPWRAYAWAPAIVAGVTLVCRPLRGHFDNANVVMVYLAAVAVISVRQGRGPAILAAVLGVAAFDFFFVPPHLTFAVEDAQYVVTFVVMLAVGLLISTLAVRAREEAAIAEGRRQEVETERLRNTLLSSVSHDLRTPLAAITSAASALDGSTRLEEAARRELLDTVASEARHLDRLLTNVLDMTRVSAGPLRLRREWQPLEEVVGSALARLEDRLDGRRVETRLPDDLPLVPIDSLLVEQLLVNLLDNVVRHAGAGASVAIRARREDGAVTVEVADDGRGLPAGGESRVFERFYRGTSTETGLGLGLSICAAIVTAHGGTIDARNLQPHGACFRFTLPLEGDPPPSRPAEEAG